MITLNARRGLHAAFMALAMVVLVACDDDGPAEEAGERIDNAAKNLKEAGDAAVGK